MAGSNTASDWRLVSRNTSGTAFSKALGLYVGRRAGERRFTAKEVERGSGVPARMVEAYLAGPDSDDWRNPSHENILSLFAFLRADFAADWLKEATLGAFELPEEEPDPGALAADNADDNAIVTRAAANRDFDDEERPSLRVVGTRMVSRGAQLAALGQRPARRVA